MINANQSIVINEVVRWVSHKQKYFTDVILIIINFPDKLKKYIARENIDYLISVHFPRKHVVKYFVYKSPNRLSI